MIAEHEKKTIAQFYGTFRSGTADVVPLQYDIENLNVSFDTNEVKTRPGYVLDLPFTGTILRVHTYEKTNEATRYLILRDNGAIYDSTAPSTAILTINGMVDFSCQVMFDKAYISPHNGVTGMPGEKVYVYEGAGLARLAGGNPPVSAPTVINSTSAGHVEAGLHLFAVAFETNSGFITQEGPAVQLVSTGGFKVDVSSIPIGPSGTIGRYILATKLIIGTYNGNKDQYEFYFVPNGRIGDNFSTSISVDFFDADLLASGDYLRNQLATIPAGVGLGLYKGALCVCGEDANPARVRVSKFNDPESHDSVAGYVECYPKDNGGSVKAVVEFRTQLNIHKSFRSYVTIDNGNSPSFWPVNSLDVAVGTECFGIAKVLDINGSTGDNYIAASRKGLMIFNGLFSMELSANFSDNWQRITRTHFNLITVALDPIHDCMYVMVPLDGATVCTHFFYVDFAEGLDVETVKWSLWSMSRNLSAVFVDLVFSTKRAEMKFAGSAGNIYKMDLTTKNDDGIAIDSYIRFAQISFDNARGMCFFSGIRPRISGEGVLQIRALSIDEVLIVDAASISLFERPGLIQLREFFLQSEACSIRLRVSNNNEWFSLRELNIFGVPLWNERPNI